MNKKPPPMPSASFLANNDSNNINSISSSANASNSSTAATGAIRKTTTRRGGGRSSSSSNINSSNMNRQSGSGMLFAVSATNGAQGASNAANNNNNNNNNSSSNSNTSMVTSSAANGGATGSSSSSRRREKRNDKDEEGGGGGGGLCGCQKEKQGPKSYCITATGVLLLVLLYVAMGSIIFVTLEGEIEDGGNLETAVAASKPYPRTELANAEIRSRTVDRLWSITEDLNILYKENWTRLAAQEVQLFQDTLLRAVRQSKVYQPGGVQMNAPAHKWTYSSAFLYSMTLITTIGYGGVSPRTEWGRIVALIYALFGIPLLLIYLSAMGDALSAAMRFLFRRRDKDEEEAADANSKAATEQPRGQQQQQYAGRMVQYGINPAVYQQQQQQQQLEELDHDDADGAEEETKSAVPISVCVCILVCYVSSGAIVFHRLQSWSVLESIYFCFCCLMTIGFGELAPTNMVSHFAAAAYILMGMAVAAMCFNLIHVEVAQFVRRLAGGGGGGGGGGSDTAMPKVEEVALVSVAVTPRSS
ncbi:CG42340 [Drosophila busckii]|uniref:CG42340 n=1 Tax=Drosophila busckii TaxID=30019 RepID=A0A0M3QZE2_DROBS|nr:CG42340 [Drosophila busckii]